jgi:hypothetical protein
VNNGYFVWRQIGQGNYRRFTAPELIIASPGYFYCALMRANGMPLVADVRRQVDIVAARAAHILPPQSREQDQFVFEFDDQLRLQNISIGPSEQERPGATSVLRKHLNLAVVQHLQGSSEAPAIVTLKKFVIDTYFNGVWKPQPRRVELFFENDDNFDLTCRQQHLLTEQIVRRSANRRRK